jgi:ribosomal protein S18
LPFDENRDRPDRGDRFGGGGDRFGGGGDRFGGGGDRFGGGGDRFGGGGDRFGGGGDRFGGGGDRFGGGGDRFGGDRFDRGDRFGDRREGGGSVKSRLRAKARKKDRKNRKRTFARKKVSRLTTDKTVVVDYKDPKLLRSFLSETGKILPRRITGNTAKQQRSVSLAVKRARHLALLPYPPNMA